MQKPLRLFRSTPLVEQAILAARREALAAALNFVPQEFTLDRLLREIVGLSYRAEVRPENKAAKIRSIIEAGRAELERIYLPLLAELPHVERRGDGFADLRPADERAPRARRHPPRAPALEMVPPEPPVRLAELSLLREAAPLPAPENLRRGGEDP